MPKSWLASPTFPPPNVTVTMGVPPKPDTPTLEHRHHVRDPGSDVEDDRDAVGDQRGTLQGYRGDFPIVHERDRGVEVVPDLHHGLLVLQRGDLVLRLGDLVRLDVEQPGLDVKLLVGAQHGECFRVLFLQRGQDQCAVGPDVVGQLDRLLQVDREPVDGRGGRARARSRPRRPAPRSGPAD